MPISMRLPGALASSPFPNWRKARERHLKAPFLAGLSSTFCQRCYLGIASAGGAGLDDEKAALLSILRAGAAAAAVEAMPNWTTEEDPSQQIESEAPFVVWCGEGRKHLCVQKIVDWYEEKNISIAEKDVPLGRKG